MARYAGNRAQEPLQEGMYRKAQNGGVGSVYAYASVSRRSAFTRT